MKHIFTKAIFCMVTLLLASSLWAQDIIVTTDSKKIEAKILEVSDSEIKYKEKDYLEGPTFVMSTNKISSVLYSNGKVVLYNQSPAAEKKEEPQQVQIQTEQQVIPSAASIDENTAELLLLSGNILTVQITDIQRKHVAYILNGKAYTMPASQIEKVRFILSGQERTFNDNENAETQDDIYHHILTRSGNTYYYDGKSMRGSTYATFLSKNCRQAHQTYSSGHNVAIAGWVLFGIGVGLDVGFSWWLPYSWVPALGCEIACIPTLITGYVRMHQSVDIYNMSCSNKKSQAYWSINASQNGIGFAYNF